MAPRTFPRTLGALTLAVATSATSWGRAEDAPAPTEASRPFELHGYAEAFYQWNANRPSNGVTHARGFDNRHNTFTIANVVVDATWDVRNVVGELALQIGHTPSTYYLAEPALRGASMANASSSELWKYVQQAYAGYRFPVLDGLTVTAGVFLSPIGPETIAVRDNWNWSRSNLFFGLPFYHTGLRASLAVDERHTVTLGVVNGWNSVVDGNEGKSVFAQWAYRRAPIALSVLYFVGSERKRGAPEGQPLRHLLDAHVTWTAARWLSVLAHLDGGLERHAFGTSRWAAGALYAKVRLAQPLHLILRGDALYEGEGSEANGRAESMFFGVPWVSSRTATLDYQPDPRVSFRLEARHDDAAAPLYFGSDPSSEAADAPLTPTRATQSTLTLGVTGGF